MHPGLHRGRRVQAAEASVRGEELLPGAFRVHNLRPLLLGQQ